MLGMEEILCELDEHAGGGLLPPGFRFHPTDEELITFYLASKVFNGATLLGGSTTTSSATAGVEIAEVDLNRCEPWELPDVAKMGEREWYFFSLRDRKYPTGLRTNRATGAGYWKATGKDREVYAGGALLGMKKTLVFYKGRAPRGEKTKWVMHEYRLDGDFSCRHTGKEEWVICRIFHKIGDKKNTATIFLNQPHQSYIFPNNTNPNSLPPLLEPPPPTMLFESQCHQDDYPTIMQTLNQNSFLNDQGDYPSELKALINPLNILHSSTSSSDNNILKRPFFPNQDFTFRELSNAIAKQCKKEGGGGGDSELACFQLQSGGNARWVGSTNTAINQDSPFLFELGAEMGLIQSTNVAHHDHANAVSSQPAFKWW